MGEKSRAWIAAGRTGRRSIESSSSREVRKGERQAGLALGSEEEGLRSNSMTSYATMSVREVVCNLVEALHGRRGFGSK